MSIAILEDRLKHELPEEFHDDIEREVGIFVSEISRLSHEDDKIGQASVTPRELEKLPTTNQHGENGFTTIELQCIKAAAIKYDISNWTDRIDSSLTYEENIHEFESSGSKRNMRELAEIR